MTSRKPKAEARGVWIVEVRGKLPGSLLQGWRAFELAGEMPAMRVHILNSLARFGEEYRPRRYIPAKTPRPAKRKR